MIENKNRPLWLDTVDIKSFPALDKNIKTDILIIGGGLSGVLTAHRLKTAGKEVVLVEASNLGGGITHRTTAFVSAQHDTMYQYLVKDLGFTKAKRYLEANIDAVHEYEKLSKEFDFDYQTVDSCFFSKDNLKCIKEEIDILHKMNFDAKFVEKIPLPIPIVGGVVFPNQGQMNPLKLINHLCQDLTIYENTKIIDINQNIAKTKDFVIKANKIIICTHFPIYNNILYSTRMYQVRSYVLGIEDNIDLKGTYTDISKDGLYFRKYHEYLIVGGSDTRTGKSGDGFKKVKSFVESNFPAQEIKYAWANQDLVTLDNVPYIGRINTFNNDLYVATGFNLWGMTSSMISACLLTDLITGKKNRYETLYKPNRCMLKKQLFNNMLELIKDEMGINKKRCTHLGCVLKYNAHEDSWDCPCHGSRFSSTGEVLNEPAHHQLKEK